ncbi:hypothetical protein [Streptomyces sp. FIT100]|uniref:Pepco domain-containing protein n=1 Tax=Streptomyces sp. FIT100 TaxID=2837956 RepID=UPI0021C6A024|nr:hypothetical protein [Streptomyces sp. FIT100]UUN28692.1 hypothetical protein KK483_21630 [Streptomyces sp. FIT100]
MTVQDDGRRTVLPAPRLEILVDAEGLDELDQPGGGLTKGFRRPGRDTIASVTVATDHVARNVESAVAAVRQIFERVAHADSAFPLREVQVSFEISAKGGFQLVGTSEVQGKGAITLVFGAAADRAQG